MTFQNISTVLQKSEAFATKVKQVPKPDLGFSGGLKVIAIGPKGGKIVGYNAKGEAIYGGSPAASKLEAHKAAKDSGASSAAFRVGAWLKDLGFDHKLSAELVAVSPKAGQKLADAFGLTPATKSLGFWSFKIPDLAV